MLKWSKMIIWCSVVYLAAGFTAATSLDWESMHTLPFDSTLSMNLKGGPDGYFHMILSQATINSFYHWYATDSSTYSEEIVNYPDVGTMFCAIDFWGLMPYTVIRYKEDENMTFSIRSGSSWTSPSAIPDTTPCYAIATDTEPDGTTHIAWILKDSEDNSVLMHSVSGPSVWNHHIVFTIAEHAMNQLIDMKLDSNNIAHFAWFDSTFNTIGYAVEVPDGGYSITGVYDTDSCRWIKIDFLSPDIPVIGYLTGSTVAESKLQYSFKVGSTFYNAVALDTTEIYKADMAINREGTITTTEWYFLLSLPSGIHYMYPGSGSWELHQIDELSEVSSNVSLSADWNSTSQNVGLAISDFTADKVYFISSVPASPTPTPTATPDPCTGLECIIDMPSAMYHPDDTCYCNVILCNPGPKTYVNLPVFVILDVYGIFYFAPDFNDYGYFLLESLPPGSDELEILPEFTWPSDAGSASDIHFYAGMTDRDITELIGEYDMFTFGWSE